MSGSHRMCVWVKLGNHLSGIAHATTAQGQTIANRYLLNGMIGFVNNMNGTIIVALASLTYTSCIAAIDGSCGSSSADTFAVWNFNAIPVPVPAVIWLFGSVILLLARISRRKLG